MQNTPTPASSSSASSSSAEEARPKYSSCHNKAQEQNKGERHKGLECRVLLAVFGFLLLLLLLLLWRRLPPSTLHVIIKNTSTQRKEGGKPLQLEIKGTGFCWLSSSLGQSLPLPLDQLCRPIVQLTPQALEVHRFVHDLLHPLHAMCKLPWCFTQCLARHFGHEELTHLCNDCLMGVPVPKVAGQP